VAELILVYGGTGSFKTAQLHFLAKYVYKKWGKVTQLASCDGGGWKPLMVGDDGSILSTDVAGGYVGAVVGPYARAE